MCSHVWIKTLLHLSALFSVLHCLNGPLVFLDVVAIVFPCALWIIFKAVWSSGSRQAFTPCGPGPYGLPWALMGRALIGHPWALMGRDLIGTPWALLGLALTGPP